MKDILSKGLYLTRIKSLELIKEKETMGTIANSQVKKIRI